MKKSLMALCLLMGISTAHAVYQPNAYAHGISFVYNQEIKDVFSDTEQECKMEVDKIKHKVEDKLTMVISKLVVKHEKPYVYTQINTTDVLNSRKPVATLLSSNPVGYPTKLYKNDLVEVPIHYGDNDEVKIMMYKPNIYNNERPTLFAFANVDKVKSCKA